MGIHSAHVVWGMYPRPVPPGGRAICFMRYAYGNAHGPCGMEAYGNTHELYGNAHELYGNAYERATISMAEWAAPRRGASMQVLSCKA